MRLLVANLIVALGICLVSAPSLASAQSGDAQDRIASSAGSLEGVRTLRFVGQTNVIPQSTGEPVRFFTGSGEFQAPDRGHMIVEQPQLLQVTETLTIGQRSWIKTVDGAAWVPLSVAYAGPAPSTIAGQLREVAKYMVSPTVSESDSQSVITADIDLPRAVQEESPIPTMLGIQIGSENDQSAPVNGSTVSITIDRATNFPLSLNTTLSIVPTIPPEGLPPGQLTVVTTLSLSDFNSDDISVLVPGGE